MKDKKLKIGLATEEQVNKEFIDVWHKAEQDTITTPEENLYFVDPATFFQVLSKRRIALLQVLHSQGVSSIRKLSQLLKRNYKNVYQDVQLLKKAGLIHQDPQKRIYVPWDKLRAEIELAA